MDIEKEQFIKISSEVDNIKEKEATIEYGKCLVKALKEAIEENEMVTNYI